MSMSQSEDEIADAKSNSITRSYGKCYANRKFRPAWTEKYPWVQNKDGRAYCIVCKKMLANHNAHISRHGQNKSHFRRLRQSDHLIVEEPKYEVEDDEQKSENMEDLISCTIETESNDMQDDQHQSVQRSSSADNYLQECQRIVEIWALKLNRMEPTQNILAERFINEILFEGQMGTLHRNSMELNILETVYPGSAGPGDINVD